MLLLNLHIAQELKIVYICFTDKHLCGKLKIGRKNGSQLKVFFLTVLLPFLAPHYN